MTKLKAFAVHLGISFIIFLIILAVIIFVWYPPPFFASDGGWQGIRIIAVVDLILGPALTLIVYKQGKPKLFVDMTIIALVQLSALIWGTWVVYSERPVAAIFSEGRFSVLAASNLKSIEYDEEKLQQFDQKSPVWIYSKLPEKIDDAQKVRVRAIRQGIPVYFFPEFYRPLNDSEIIPTFLANQLNLEKWIANNEDYLKIYHAFTEKHKTDMANIAFFVWKARYGKKVIALKTDDLAYVDSLDISLPFEAEL